MGKVLVVDDDAGITTLLQRIISKKGHQIVIARNGLEGLNFARTEAPDLIFTDVRMPDMGGVELAAALKADEHLKHIPIVILSGTAYLLDNENNPADDILTKPFDLKAVYALLERFLGLANEKEAFLEKATNESPTNNSKHYSPVTEVPSDLSSNQS